MDREPHVDDRLILYDGTCGLCSRSVRFVIDRDPNGMFRFAPLQSPLGERLLRAHGLSGIDTLVLIHHGRARVRSGAVLRILRHLRWPWPLAYGLIIVPPWLRDLGYRAIASIRHRWGPPATCTFGTPGDRARFVDDA
jgi:predicted DCC family thiol-disulfide oxidoreductase YuxK